MQIYYVNVASPESDLMSEMESFLDNKIEEFTPGQFMELTTLYEELDYEAVKLEKERDEMEAEIDYLRSRLAEMEERVAELEG